MKKGRWLAVILFLLTSCLNACFAEKKPEEVAQVKYTVIADSEIPTELSQLIEEKKESEFRLTYSDGKNLYLVVGYGKKQTSGYSVSVKDFYQTKDSLYIATELLGPKKDETVSNEATYPWVVVKTEYTDMMIVFA